VVVLVGATIVGSMATVWHGVVNPPRRPDVCEWNYEPGAVSLRKGEEMGRFLLGSTVVMLFPANKMGFNPQWTAAQPVRLGENMGAAG
jgi:phosphatidylserine decarboxylase